MKSLPIEWQYIDAITPIILSQVEGCIVDLGMGLSTTVLARHARNFGRKQYSVDTNEEFLKWCAEDPDRTHDNHEICITKVTEFMKTFDDTPAIVLHDSNHRAKKVVQETSFFIEKMNPGGVLFIHDTCPMEGYYERKLAKKGREMDTYKARRILEEREGIDVLTFRQGCGLTMALKKDPNEPFYRQ